MSARVSLSAENRGKEETEERARDVWWGRRALLHAHHTHICYTPLTLTHSPPHPPPPPLRSNEKYEREKREKKERDVFIMRSALARDVNTKQMVVEALAASSGAAPVTVNTLHTDFSVGFDSRAPM